MPAFSLERKRRRKKLQKFLPKRCYLHGKSSTRSLKDVFFPSTTTATTTDVVEIPENAQHTMFQKYIQSRLKMLWSDFFLKKYIGQTEMCCTITLKKAKINDF